MSQYQENATVTRVEQLSADNYRLTFESPQIAAKGRPGQFVMVRTGVGKDPLLRRPFSIHQVTSNGRLQLYFKVVGRGTRLLALLRQGDVVNLFGPLGKGFRLHDQKPSVLIGGGLGIAPLLFLAKENCRVKKSCERDMIILGARDKSDLVPLLDDFNQFGLTLLTATDDGSLGYHGLVTELIESVGLPRDGMVYACGPEPMMAAVGDFCRSIGAGCQVSVESVMACGMGACLGCSRPAKNGTYTHVCLNGPVYNAEDLVWNT